MTQLLAKIRQHTKTSANWTSANPILLLGQRGIETDTRLEKVGDGVTAWTSLPYQRVRAEDVIGLTNVDVSGLVPKTYEVNSKALSGNITLNTSDISDTLNKRYVTDANLTVLGNTSGTNSGDQDLSGLVPKTYTVNGHVLNSNITISASDITTGTLPVSVIPQVALPVLYKYTGIETLPENMGLTSNDVQTGDTIQIENISNGNHLKLWLVNNGSALSTSASFTEYTTSIASSVNWSGINNIPIPVSNLTGTNTGDETATTIATINHGATVKTTLVDADEVTGQNSANSFSLIRTTWTNVKVFLKTYFDSLYAHKPEQITVSQSASITLPLDSGDYFKVVGLAQGATISVSGTPINLFLILKITDNGTARTLAWSTSFESSGTKTLPTTTVDGVMLTVGFIWNDVTSKWTCIGVS